jgi:hypothetical protein
MAPNSDLVAEKSFEDRLAGGFSISSSSPPVTFRPIRSASNNDSVQKPELGRRNCNCNHNCGGNRNHNKPHKHHHHNYQRPEIRCPPAGSGSAIPPKALIAAPAPSPVAGCAVAYNDPQACSSYASPPRSATGDFYFFTSLTLQSMIQGTTLAIPETASFWQVLEALQAILQCCRKLVRCPRISICFWRCVRVCREAPC